MKNSLTCHWYGRNEFLCVQSIFLERNGIAPINNKANLSTDTSPRKGLETPKMVRKIKSQNSITVSLPSPAGNRRSSRTGSTSSNHGNGTSKTSKGPKNWDKMNKVRKTVRQFSSDKTSPKDGSSSGGGGSSPQSQHPPLKQSASARQLGSTSSNGGGNGGMSPSQSIKKKKKKKKALPMSATVAVVAAAGRSDSLKVTNSSPNLGKFGPTRASQ